MRWCRLGDVEGSSESDRLKVEGVICMNDDGTEDGQPRRNSRGVFELGGSAKGLHVVRAPQGTDSRLIAADPSVQDLDNDGNLFLPEAGPGFRGQASAQVSGLGAPTTASLFGVQVLGSYVNQAAGSVISLAGARVFSTGAGTVAIIRMPRMRVEGLGPG